MKKTDVKNAVIALIDQIDDGEKPLRWALDQDVADMLEAKDKEIDRLKVRLNEYAKMLKTLNAERSS